jgi:hypothetical protein
VEKQIFGFLVVSVKIRQLKTTAILFGSSESSIDNPGIGKALGYFLGWEIFYFVNQTSTFLGS